MSSGVIFSKSPVVPMGEFLLIHEDQPVVQTGDGLTVGLPGWPGFGEGVGVSKFPSDGAGVAGIISE